MILTLLVGLALLSSSISRPVGELFVTGLNQPRGMAFDDAGNLLVAEAGAIDTQAADGQPISTNRSSRVVRIAPDRRVTPSVGGLPFTHYVAPGTNAGATDVAVLDGTLYVLTGEGDDQLSRSVLRATPGRSPQPVASILDFAMARSPLAQMIGSSGVAANPYAMVAAPDGSGLYVTDGASGRVFRLTRDGKIQIFAEVPDMRPLTGLAFGPNGKLYFADFSALPHTPGSGRIWTVDRSGTLAVAVEDLTMPIDVGFDAAGTMYVLEFSRGRQPDQPYVAGAGRLLRIENDASRTVVLDRLNYPTALAFSRAGDLYISVSGAFSAPGQGAILKVPCSTLSPPEACPRLPQP